MTLLDALSEFAASVLVGFFLWSVPLVLTIAIEVVVAAAFGLGRRGMRAVALINVITNPVLNFVILVLYGLGIGFVSGQNLAWFALTSNYYYVLVALECVVVVVEWRMLVWALRGSSVSAGRLLVTSLVMNAASCLTGLMLVAGFGG